MVNNPTFLEEEIMSDIAERQDLMSRIKALSPRYSFSLQDEELFLKYSIPIVYSIWEGFLQTSFQIYIRELNQLNLNINAICESILIYHLEAEFPQFKQYPDKDNKKVKFFQKLSQFYQSNTLQISTKFNTESNVGFNVLNKILKDFNLETIPEYTKPGYSIPDELDKFLLKIRNDVAHGQNSLRVTRGDLDRAIELVNQLMSLVFERIKNGFIQKSYLR